MKSLISAQSAYIAAVALVVLLYSAVYYGPHNLTSHQGTSSHKGQEGRPHLVHLEYADGIGGGRPLLSLPSVYNRAHWLPDWDISEDDVATMLHKRRQTIIKRCGQLKRGKKLKVKVKGISPRWIHRRGISYCATFKGGYRFWKSILYEQIGKPHYRRSEHSRPPADPATKVLTFTVIRNPWHRLVSAWHDRFSGEHGDVPGIQERSCLGKQWDGLIPFSVYIDECVLATYYRNSKGNYVNYHWATVLDRCTVCDLSESQQFDFFIAQENMEQEAMHMLRDVYKLENTTSFFQETHEKVLNPSEKSGFSATYQQQWTNVSRENIELIRKMYANEIFLFGYPSTPFVDFPKA